MLRAAPHLDGLPLPIRRFADIPPFVPEADYRVDVRWDRLPAWLEEEVTTTGTTVGEALNPDYQRDHVWTRDQQIAFLEYFLRGGRSGRDIFFNTPDFRSVSSEREAATLPRGIQCVDGKQRITAVARFLNGDFPIFGSYVHEFTDSVRALPLTFSVHVNSLLHRHEVLAWYLGLNSGGVAHSAEEIARVQGLLLAARRAS